MWDNPASVRFGGGAEKQLSIFRRGPRRADHTLSHFEVSDIEAVVRGLEERGVVFVDNEEGLLPTTGHVAQIGSARGAWFGVPDGNILGLREAPEDES